MVIYDRVYTERQNHDSQLAELRTYCDRRGWKDVGVITNVISGAKSSREGLDRVMRAVRCGKVDVVVCFRLDRLSRSLSHLDGLIDDFTISGLPGRMVCRRARTANGVRVGDDHETLDTSSTSWMDGDIT